MANPHFRGCGFQARKWGGEEGGRSRVGVLQAGVVLEMKTWEGGWGCGFGSALSSPRDAPKCAHPTSPVPTA